MALFFANGAGEITHKVSLDSTCEAHLYEKTESQRVKRPRCFLGMLEAGLELVWLRPVRPFLCVLPPLVTGAGSWWTQADIPVEPHHDYLHFRNWKTGLHSFPELPYQHTQFEWLKLQQRYIVSQVLEVGSPDSMVQQDWALLRAQALPASCSPRYSLAYRYITSVLCHHKLASLLVFTCRLLMRTPVTSD